MSETQTYIGTFSGKTDKLNREAGADALHHWLFSWSRRWWSASSAVDSQNEMRSDAMAMSGRSVSISPVLMADISLEEWQHHTISQLMHTLILAMSQKGRAQDMSYIKHLHMIQQAGEISVEQFLDRLHRLFPAEMLKLPLHIRAKLSSIRQELH